MPMVIRGEGEIQPQRIEDEIILPRGPDILILGVKKELEQYEKIC